MKKLPYLIFLLCLAYGAIGDAPAPISIPDIIDEGRNLYFNGEYTSASQLFTEMPDAPIFYHAVAEHFLGRIARDMGDFKRARVRLEVSEKLLSMAVAESATAEIYALWADTKSQLLLVRGISYVIRNSGKIRALAQLSLEIDPNNALATLVIARGKINAPRIFGGSVTQGVDLINSVLEMDHLRRFELFLAHHGLAVAFEKEDQINLAATQISLALDLYPENPDALELLERIDR